MYGVQMQELIAGLPRSPLLNSQNRDGSVDEPEHQPEPPPKPPTEPDSRESSRSPRSGLPPAAVKMLDQMKQKARTAGQLFSSGDADRNDKLDFEEFRRGLAMLGLRPVPTRREAQVCMCVCVAVAV